MGAKPTQPKYERGQNVYSNRGTWQRLSSRDPESHRELSNQLALYHQTEHKTRSDRNSTITRQKHFQVRHKSKTTMAILKKPSPSGWIEARDNRLAHQQNSQQHSPVPSQTLPLAPEYNDMSDSASTIRVAIVGGGVTGAALLRGLLRYPHIAVDMYESRPNFKEDGPSLDFSPAAQDILGALDPALHTCLDHAGAVYCSTDYRIATGPLAGQRIDVDGPQGRITRTVSRQALLTELLAGVPPRMMHPNTRITSVVEASPDIGLTLTFSDGAQKRYDVVIGADGSHGKTRAHIIGPDDPAQRPRSSGLWTLPVKVPLERAQMMMGPGALDPRSPRRVCFIGDGTNMQYSFLDNGRDVQFIAAAAYNGSGEEFSWAKLFSPQEFEQIFSQNIIQECQGMVKVRIPQPFPLSNFHNSSPFFSLLSPLSSIPLSQLHVLETRCISLINNLVFFSFPACTKRLYHPDRRHMPDAAHSNTYLRD
jgi:2-polyprenyl-6-methoxyphenol hydroxylase-like FAD-dependent oxidoreductase